MNDAELENYLREFAPRKPKPLPAVEAGRMNWRRLAAAAAILLACGASLWVGLQSKRVAQSSEAANRQTSKEIQSAWRLRIVLTNQALESPATFEAELAEEAGASLPRLDGRESTLRVLARE